MPTKSQQTRLVEVAKRALPWVPNPGPQAKAFLSHADELYFGGAAGGGKTQILIGLALTQHRDSLLLRRQAVDAKALSKSILSLGYGSWKWAGSGGELRTPDRRTVEVGGCQHEDDKVNFQGQPHDFIGFDELPHFSESQYTFIIGWNRPLDPRRNPNQRCRVVGAGNPPTDPEGEWVLRRWRAWLDPAAGRKAKAGELRWYTTIDGKEVECEDARPLTHRGVIHTPRSRSFIPAKLEDNPDLLRTGYAATLEAMPEPLRSMLRFGDMATVRDDDRWQLIPTRWVVLAQRRWAEQRDQPRGPVDAVGVDVARGGKDRTILAPRHNMTIGEFVDRPGSQTPDGPSVVALLLQYGFTACQLNIDAIGVGASVYDTAIMSGLADYATPVVVSQATTYTDPDVPAFRFANVRSAMMWNVRKLLDPDNQREPRLALPPDPELLADLTAPRYALRTSGIAVESKDDIRKRLGRSTDKGDAVGLACWQTAAPGAYSTDPVDSPDRIADFPRTEWDGGMAWR